MLCYCFSDGLFDTEKPMTNTEALKYIYDLAKFYDSFEQFEKAISKEPMPEGCPKCGCLTIKTNLIGFIHECKCKDCKHIF